MHKKNIIIIRHGRSLQNLGLTKDLNEGITDYGVTMSKCVGQFLRKNFDLNDFDWYTSPFLRCLQTTRHIVDAAYYCPFQVQVDARLREYLGHAMPWDQQLEVKVPQPFIKDFSTTAGKWTFTHETNEQLHHRTLDFYEETGDNVIVVSHGLPCLVLAHIAKDPTMHHIPLWDNSINNASITWIRNGRGVWWGRTLQHERVEDMGP